MPERVLVETDFLFGLRRRDELHEAVMALLKEARAGRVAISLSPAAPLEATLVMRSAGLDDSSIARALGAMQTILSMFARVESPGLSLSHAALAAELRERYGLSLFDSIHGAVALAERLIYVGSDESVREAVESEGGRTRPLR
ncbi:MAG: hypothetical protein DRO01_07410 [Thermoproteota archaeon]|nr:MAG: hypothetical protein DRO01_07410 [Candidatus Korarchaeota archaeon]